MEKISAQICFQFLIVDAFLEPQKGIYAYLIAVFLNLSQNFDKQITSIKNDTK